MCNEARSYAKYYVRKSLKPFLFILTVAVIVTVLLCSQDRAVTYSFSSTVRFNLQFDVPVIIATVVAYIQVAYQLSVFKKRRNLDCYYSLPIARRTVGTVHFITGLAITLITFTVSLAINLLLFIPAAVKYSPDIHCGAIVLYYLISVIEICAVYSVLSFAFDRGNTAGDGRWLMALYSFAPALLSGAIIRVVVRGIFHKSYFGSGNGILPVLFISTSDLFQDLAFGIQPRNTYLTELVAWMIGWCVLGIFAAVGFFCFFGRQQAYRTEEYSDSPFAFKLLIPVFVFLGLLNFADLELLVFILIGVLAVIGYVIYRRGFRLKRPDVISLAVSVVAAILVMLLIDKP